MGVTMKKILIALLALGQIYAGGGCSKPKAKSVWDDGEAVAAPKLRRTVTQRSIPLEGSIPQERLSLASNVPEEYLAGVSLSDDLRFRRSQITYGQAAELGIRGEVIPELVGDVVIDKPFPHRISSIDTGEDDNEYWKLSMQDTASAQDEGSSGLRVSPTKVSGLRVSPTKISGRRNSISIRQSQMLANRAAIALITQKEEPTAEQLADIGEENGDSVSESGE